MEGDKGMNQLSGRPFTTAGSRSQPAVEIINDNRPKTAFPHQSQMKLPKLRSEQNLFENRKPLLNNYIASNSQVKNTASVDDGSQGNLSSPLGILSRSNSKRGLLKKIKSWRQRSACGNDINLDDSISTVNSGEITRPVTAWDEFENHIRQVNDNSGPMEFDEKTLDFKCSDTFKRIMNELSPRKVKKIEKKLSTSSLLSKRETLIGEGGENGDIKEEEEVEGDIDDDDDDNDAFVVGETDHDPRRRKRALRAWGLIRRHIQEIRVERRMANGSINWDFLRQTVSALSNMEKARQELYEKYIYKPNWWADGLTRCPEHLVRKYQNSGPLLPPVTESNTNSDAKSTKETGHSRPSTSLRKSAQSSQGSRRPTSRANHSRMPLQAH